MARWSGWVTGLAAVGLAAGICGPSRAAVKYNVTDLSTPSVGAATMACAINGQGQVAEFLPYGNLAQQMVWAGDQTTYLPTGYLATSLKFSVTPGSANVGADPVMGINNLGWVAGVAGKQALTHLGQAANPIAAYWNGTTPTVLGTLGGSSSGATGISADGTPVGWSSTQNDAAVHAFRYERLNSQSGPVMRDIGTLGSGSQSRANAINGSRIAVGWSEIAPKGSIHAFCDVPGALFVGGTVYFTHKLIDLHGPGSGNSSALSISDSGLAVGSYSYGGQTMGRAWQLDSAGHVTGGNTFTFIKWDGSQLALSTDTVACGCNNKGQIVGSALLPSTVAQHAFLTDTTTWSVQDLNDLIPANSGWTLIEARSINDSGEIVGFGVHVTDPNVDPALQVHAFLLRPQ